jgi:PPK2 family polyphosphate:nucleotide phosphotransferase
MMKTHRVSPGSRIRLEQWPTSGKDFCPDRDAAEAEFKTLRKEFRELQFRLHAENERKLLIVFQAMDAGGKDGAIRRVFQGVNPQGVRVVSFKVPSSRELARDYLWRVHREVPDKGTIGVFNRSHYEDVLVVRVERLVPKSVWRARYEQINQFEKLLLDTGTTILKFYLHISQDEQKERFQARLDDPTRRWKFSLGDLEKRKKWDDYRLAYADAITRCSSDWAPWHIIPADQKWYRNLAISRVIVGTLRKMDPCFPQPDSALQDVELE